MHHFLVIRPSLHHNPDWIKINILEDVLAISNSQILDVYDLFCIKLQVNEALAGGLSSMSSCIFIFSSDTIHIYNVHRRQY